MPRACPVGPLFRRLQLRGQHRFGFAAGCEAWLCLAVVASVDFIGLSPRFGLSPNLVAGGRSPNLGAKPQE